MKSKPVLLVFPALVLAFLVAALIHGCVNESDKPYRGSMEVLKRPPLVSSDDTYEGPKTHENASAVFWNKKMYLFYPTQDPDNEIHYRTFDGSDYSDGITLKIDGDVQNTSAQMTPLVANKQMYLFFTGHDSGYLDWTYLDLNTGLWKGMYRVESGSNKGSTGTNNRYAAVFNTQRQIIEVYWIPQDSSEIHYAYHSVDKDGYPTGSWAGFQKLPNSKSADGHLSAVYYQTGDSSGVTYLALRNGQTAYVHHIENFTITSTDANAQWGLLNKSFGPTLTDLGEDKMAMIWKGCDGCSVYYQYYDKINSSWDANSKIKIVDVDTNDWLPNGAIFYNEVSDSGSPTGKRYDAMFSIIYGHWKSGSLSSVSVWKVKEAEYMGYWWPTATPVETKFDKDEEMVRKTFYLWPMLALVDAPPYVANGATGEYDCDHSANSLSCTEVSINQSNSSKTLFGVEGKCGGYVETGKKSPVTFQMSMGLSGAYESGKEYTIESTDSLTQNPEGMVMAFYLAPTIQTTTLEWYNKDKQATGIFTYPIKVTDFSVRKFVFNPYTGPTYSTDNGLQPYDNITPPYINYPRHEGATDDERLATYQYPITYGGRKIDPKPDPTSSDYKYQFIANSSEQTWTAGGYNNCVLKVTEEGSNTIGGYVDIKIGAEMKKIIGAGVEGSLEIYQTTSYTKEASMETHLENPEPKNVGDVTNIQVDACWLKPDVNGYWVPNNPYQTRSAPSFATFKVGGAVLHK